MAEKVDQMDPNEKIVEIAIERLRVFENHPFRVEMGSQMKRNALRKSDRSGKLMIPSKRLLSQKILCSPIMMTMAS